MDGAGRHPRTRSRSRPAGSRAPRRPPRRSGSQSRRRAGSARASTPARDQAQPDDQAISWSGRALNHPCHARPCARHPRLINLAPKDVDGRVKPGHDVERNVIVVEKVLAAVRTGPSRTEFREYPMPEIPPDGALMKMEVAGICGTDVKLYAHPPNNKPTIMGHENIGVI